jgi:predicted RNase H-like nuclease
VAILDPDAPSAGAEIAVARSFTELLQRTAQCAAVGVDIPIGLLDERVPGGRFADLAARKLVGPARAPSIFSPPARRYLSLNSFAEAVTTGAGLSRQAFAILPKIREVDQVMTARLQERVREVHPEVAFHQLAGRPLLHRKKRAAGRRERAEILARFGVPADRILEEARGCWSRQDFADDDLYDALAGTLVAKRIVGGEAKTLPENPPLDSRGLRMEIVY